MIHIADRESDSFHFFQTCLLEKQSFVVRVRQNRAIEEEEGRLFCLARYGGFIKQKNARPGWLILCRALVSLEDKVAGWKAVKQVFLQGGKEM